MGCPKVFSHFKFQITLYSLGFLAGIAALVGYSFFIINIPAALLGSGATFYSAVLIIELLTVHNVHNRKDILPVDESQKTLALKLVVSVVGMTVSAILCLFFILKIFVNDESAAGPSPLSAVQAWMMFKWSSACTFHFWRTHNVQDADSSHTDFREVESQ